jgi:hypothetical protein
LAVGRRTQWHTASSQWPVPVAGQWQWAAASHPAGTLWPLTPTSMVCGSRPSPRPPDRGGWAEERLALQRVVAELQSRCAAAEEALEKQLKLQESTDDGDEDEASTTLRGLYHRFSREQSLQSALDDARTQLRDATDAGYLRQQQEQFAREQAEAEAQTWRERCTLATRTAKAEVDAADASTRAHNAAWEAKMDEVLVQLGSERELRTLLEKKIERDRQRPPPLQPPPADELRADAEKLRAKMSVDTERFREELEAAEGRIHWLQRELRAARTTQVCRCESDIRPVTRHFRRS